MTNVLLPSPVRGLTQHQAASREFMLHVFRYLNDARLHSRRDTFIDSRHVEWNVLSLQLGNRRLFLDTSYGPGSENLTVAIRLDHQEKSRWTVTPGRIPQNVEKEVIAKILDLYRDECRRLGEELARVLKDHLGKIGLQVQENVRITGLQRSQLLRLKTGGILQVEIVSSKSGLKAAVNRNGRDLKIWPVQPEYFDANGLAGEVVQELEKLISK